MSFKEKIVELKASIDSHKAEALAFVKLAESETRELTKDEQASIAKITDEVVPKLLKDLDRNEKLEVFATEGKRENSVAELSDPAADHNKIVVPATAKRHAQLKAFKGPDAEEDAYVSGKWLLATIGQHEESKQWCMDHGINVINNAMTTTDNQLGGYTVPNPMEVSIIALRDEHGVFRRNAYNETMISDTKSISRPVGGIVAYFTGEGVTGTESDSQYKNINLIARKLMVLARMSKELSVDSIVSIADQVSRDSAFAFAQKEDQCGFIGDGTDTYGGITGLIGALLATSKYESLAGNTSFAELDLVDFESMAGQLPAYAESGAKWYISKRGYFASMANLMDAVGGNTKSDLAGAPIRTFLGYPVEFVEVMNTTLTAQTSTDGLCYLGDLALAATLANRTGISMESSTEVYFTSDQIAIKGTERFGINVHEVGAATGDAGPIIMLSTPSS